MFEPSDREIVKRTGPKTARILNLRGILQHPVEAESSLEADFVRRAALSPRAADIVHQPFKITLRRGRYTPDFLVVLNDGTKYVVEVKLRRKVRKYREVFDEVSSMIADRGGRFLVTDEYLIRGGHAHVRAALVLRHLKATAFPKDLCDDAVRAVARSGSGLAIKDVMSEARVTRALLYHLISVRRLVIDERLHLDDGAFLFIPGSDAANDVDFFQRHSDALWISQPAGNTAA